LTSHRIRNNNKIEKNVHRENRGETSRRATDGQKQQSHVTRRREAADERSAEEEEEL